MCKLTRGFGFSNDIGAYAICGGYCGTIVEDSQNSIEILVATGDVILGSQVKRILEGDGFQVCCEASGEDIIQRIAQNGCALLLLDCHLPDLSAKEVLEGLKEGQCIPHTLVMVDKEEQRMIVDLVRMGASACILKIPGFMDRLPKVVRRTTHSLYSTNIPQVVDEEDRLRDNQQLLQVVAGAMGRGLCICDENGRVVEANVEYLRLTGRDRFEDIMNHSLLEWTAAYDVERNMEVFEQLLEQGTVRDLDVDYVHPNGNIVPVSISGGMIHVSGERSVFVICSDMTKHKRAQEEIRDGEEKQRMVVENIEEGLFIIDGTGIVTYSNPKTCRISGYALDELIGLHIAQLVSSEWHYFMMAKFLDTIEGNTQCFESGMVKKDGSTAPVEITVTPLRRNGEVIEVIGMVRDMTERKRTETMLREFADDVALKNQQLQAAERELALLNRDLENKVEERTAEVQRLLQQKEEFLRRLGHDLKSPLTPIMTLLPIVMRHEEDSEQKEMLDVAVQSAEYMQDLVIKILKLARLDSISSSPQLEDLSLLREVDSVLSGKLIIANEKGVAIENAVDQDLIVRADRLGLQEVVDNLVSNALKFVQEDGVINVKAHEKDGIVCVSVSDTGIGMNEEQASHVFDEFYRADEVGGELRSSGLGLSICKRIIEKHGGTIWVESLGLGKGSSFYFTLSAGDPDSVAPADKMSLSGRSTMWRREWVRNPVSAS